MFAVARKMVEGCQFGFLYNSKYNQVSCFCQEDCFYQENMVYLGYEYI